MIEVPTLAAWALLNTALILVVGMPLNAQRSTREHRIRVRVVDSAEMPVSGADIALYRGLNTVVARAPSDTFGELPIIVRDDGEYHVLVRHLGFVPTDKFFVLTPSDSSVRITATLVRLPTVLQSVQITADASVRHRKLSIDAAAIENSPRRLDNAMDIVTKLRPDMVYGLGGHDFCKPANEIWVNGLRVPWQSVAVNELARARNPSVALPAWIKTVLSSIRPEHIAEMSYHDCIDFSVGRVGSDRAIFVVLKPGIAFDPGRGSYVVATPE